MNEILIALIGAVGSVVAVILANKSANDKMVRSMKIHDAVTDTKIEELTREVRAHNNFAKRVTILEEQMGHVCDDIRELQGLHKRE